MFVQMCTPYNYKRVCIVLKPKTFSKLQVLTHEKGNKYYFRTSYNVRRV